MEKTISFRSGDLRKIAAGINRKASTIKRSVTNIMRQEASEAASELRRIVGGPATTATTLQRRSGDLADSIGYDVYVSPYSIEAKIGQFLGDALQSKKLRLHSEGMILRAKRADMLAFPAETAPADIRDPLTGEQKMTAREANRVYFMIFTKHGIWGKLRSTLKKISKNKRVRQKSIIGINPESNPPAQAVAKADLFEGFQLLFIRADDVTIPKRVDFGPVLDDFKKEVMKRISELKF